MKKEKVILLHGLAETSRRMVPMEWAFRLAGYETANMDYPSTRYDAETLIEDCIGEIVRQHQNEEEISFVTHSLGGVLLHCYWEKHGIPNLKRVVMTTPAHHGSETLGLYRYNPMMAFLMGPVLQQSGKDKDCFTRNYAMRANYEVGIIAASIPKDPFSYFVMPYPHDGRATLESTRLDGMTDHILLPATHEWVTYNPLAIVQTLHFLKHGLFLHWQKRIEPTDFLKLPYYSADSMPVAA